MDGNCAADGENVLRYSLIWLTCSPISARSLAVNGLLSVTSYVAGVSISGVARTSAQRSGVSTSALTSRAHSSTFCWEVSQV